MEKSRKILSSKFLEIPRRRRFGPSTERFEQADGQRTAARYGGSGLGLAISQELASAMDGRIEVESTPGMGAVFVVELPLAAGQPRASSNVQPVCQQDALSVLLVEDDPTVADVIEGLLRAQGHFVVHAGHGLAALVEADLHPFEVALLDLDLPGIDGFSLAAQLRTNGFAGPSDCHHRTPRSRGRAAGA